MPLQREERKLYQREYRRRQRAGLPTRIERPRGKCCSLCGRPPSRERVVIASGRGVRVCERCAGDIIVLVAAQRAG